MIRAVLCALFLVAVSPIYCESEETLIPRTLLFGNPKITMVRLSPDGKYVSYLAPSEGVLNVWIAPLNHLSAAKPITQDTDRGIRQYFWAYDGAHLLYLQDDRGDENFRLYSYDLQTGKEQLLTPKNGVKTRLYGMSSSKPNEILIGLNERDPRYFDVYALNLENSTLKLVYENHEFASLITDHNLQVRFGVKTTPEGDEVVFQKKGDSWVPFMTIPMEETMNSGILGFDQKNSSVYVLDSRTTDTAVLKTLDLKKGKEKLLAQDLRADLGVFTKHPTKHTIQAVEIEYDKPTVKVLDPAIQKDIDFLSGKNSGHFVITSRSLNDKTWIVAYTSDVTPTEYYAYHRKSGKLDFLFNGNPALAKYSLAPMHPVIFKSRDGLDIVSYLTLPLGSSSEGSLSPQKPLPMVLLVHGGPWARDSWDINPVHQWLANRGYAVMSVNFRGSTGFGKKFVNAGNMEWSGKMHDDLIDGVNWAIERGIADKQKIAIMGGSYGGYATLVGLTFTPDVFACGIDIVGPSNLVTLCQSVPPYWLPIINDFKRRVGVWDTQEGIAELLTRSPLTYVDRIQKPLFIAQGANDPRVKQAEADQIVEAMQNNHIPVLYALYPSEGHGFAKPDNRLSFYSMAEQFLADILGGRAEPIGSDLQGADFVLNGRKDLSADQATALIYDHTRSPSVEKPSLEQSASLDSGNSEGE